MCILVYLVNWITSSNLNIYSGLIWGRKENFCLPTVQFRLEDLLPFTGAHHSPLTVDNFLKNFSHHSSISAECLRWGSVNQALQVYLAVYCDFQLWSCAMGPFYCISFVVIFKRIIGDDVGFTLLTYLMTLFLLDRGKFQRITLTYCTLLWSMKHFLYVFWEQNLEKIPRFIHREDIDTSSFVSSKGQQSMACDYLNIYWFLQ